MTLPTLRLKKNRARPARAGHPWLFSGAFEAIPALEPGSPCRIEDERGGFVAVGYVNPGCSLAVRLLGWEDAASPAEVEDLVRRRLQTAWDLRCTVWDAENDALRVVHGEGDFLPGLVVDRYADVLVVQVLTAGMERLLDVVVETLVGLAEPRTIFERSDVPARREEGLPMRRRLVWGEPLGDTVSIREHGLRFHVQPDAGQKTGFYLDQRDNRDLVRRRSQGREVLNVFAYTGAFSVAAVAGGARRVVSVESSAPACALLRRHLAAHDAAAAEVREADAFETLRRCREAGERYDLIVLDPPAFAKKKHQLEAARRGYKEINLQAVQMLRPGGELFTFSCSQYLDADAFKRTVAEAAANAGCRAQQLHALGASFDHPANTSHLEGTYLKGLHLRRL